MLAVRIALGRLISLPVPLLLVTAVVFFMLRLSGDPTDVYLPLDATADQRAVMHAQLGLDRPIIVQYGVFLRSLVGGDLGQSLRFNQSGMDLVLDRLPATVELTLAALLITVAGGLLVGVFAARMAGRLVDHAIVNVAVFTQSMPSFWIGLLLIMLFGVQLKWLPTSGRGGLSHLVMPAVTLALFLAPQVVLLVRSTVLDIVGEEFVRVAWAKGLSVRRVYLRHALVNALSPEVTYLGVQGGRLLGGAVITETVFAWPGLGQMSVQAIFQRDMPVVQAAVIALAILVTATNIVADLVNAYLDPRIRPA